MTRKLLEQARDLAREVLGEASEETIRVVFVRLCQDHDIAMVEQAIADRTVH